MLRSQQLPACSDGCCTVGANVWVTSSSPAKIKRAQELGAKGGVNYKDGACSLSSVFSDLPLVMWSL